MAAISTAREKQKNSDDDGCGNDQDRNRRHVYAFIAHPILSFTLVIRPVEIEHIFSTFRAEWIRYAGKRRAAPWTLAWLCHA